MEILKYRKDENSPWQDVLGIVGAQGAKGNPGERGEKGEKGDAFTYEDFTPEQLAALKGEPGKDGAPGADGKDYVLTGDDKTEIANLVLAALPNGEEVSY